MEPTSHEPLPELPRPETNARDIEPFEVVKPPEEQMEAMPRETLIKANDAIGQAFAAVPAQNTDDSNAAAITTTTANDNNPSIADDVDVIEKEWVQKAKQIVADTREDPRTQSIKINVFKHDYMKKRYGKEIKLPEEQKGN